MRDWAKILVTVIPVGLASCGGDGSTDSSVQGLGGQSGSGTNGADFQLTAWVGETDTQLEFDRPLSDLSLYSSTDAQCDLDNYSVCENSSYSPLSNDQSVLVPSVLDQRLSLWTQHNGVRSDRLTLDSEQESSNNFSPGVVVNAVLFKGRLWILTRDEVDSETVTSIGMPYTDILDKYWSSADGKSWRFEASTRDLEDTQYAPYLRVLGDELFLGGAREAGSLNTSDASIVIRMIPSVSSDIAREVSGQNASSDGADWDEILRNQNLPFEQYDVVHTYVFADKLWAFVVNDSSVSIGSNEQIEIWMSSEGAVWEKQDKSNLLSPRKGFALLEFQGRLWAIGGVATHTSRVEQNLNDVWSSEDGINWRQEQQADNHIDYAPVHKVKFDDKLWLISDSNYFNKPFTSKGIWSSENGITWQRELPAQQFMPQSAELATAFKGRLWLIGSGDSSDGTQSFDQGGIWSSVDGQNWKEETYNLDFEPRNFQQAFVHQEKIWVTSAEYEKVFWTSSDGINWEETPAPYFDSLTVHNDQLIMLTTSFDNGNQIQLSSSIDGQVWSELAIVDIDEPFYSTELQSTGEVLWLLVKSGVANSNYHEVLSSVDGGRNWQSESKNPPFVSSINDDVSYTFAGRLWTQAYGHTWSSADGRDWRKGVVGRFEMPQ